MWWDLAWAVLVLLTVIFMVGGAVGYALGLRGLWLAASAPAITVPVVGGAAVLAPMAGIPWSIVPVAAAAATGALVVWLARRWWGRRMARRRFQARSLLAVAIPAVIIAAQVVVVIGNPLSFSNTFDNVFHLNVVRFILDTSNASSLWVGHLTDHSGTAAFYPAAWHDIVSLAAQLAGVDIRVAVNAMTLVISAVIWPLGVVLLTRQLFGANRVVTVAAGVLAASFPLFPLLMMDYGVLFPYQLGVALLPATLAATARVVGIGQSSRGMKRWQGWVLVGGMLVGVVLAHPGAFVAWMAFTIPIAMVLVVRVFTASRRMLPRIGVIGGLIAYLVAGLGLLMLLRPSSGRDWPIEMRVRHAALEVVTGSAWYGVPAVLAVSLVIVGAAWAIGRRRPSALMTVGMLAVAAVLYIVVASLPYPHLRDLLTGSWYNNRPRLAALLPLMAVPLGAYGAGATWAWLRSRAATRRMRSALPRPARVAVGAFVLVLACVLTQLPAVSPVPRAVAWASEAYRTSPTARLVSTDELALINRLPNEVPVDAVIVGSPWTGTALAYAIADREVVLPHMFTTTTEAENQILSSLNSAVAGGETCDAVHDTGVAYVLWFGVKEIHGANHVFDGLIDLDDSPALQLVDQEGEAKLYRVVAC